MSWYCLSCTFNGPGIALFDIIGCAELRDNMCVAQKTAAGEELASGLFQKGPSALATPSAHLHFNE